MKHSDLLDIAYLIFLLKDKKGMQKSKPTFNRNLHEENKIVARKIKAQNQIYNHRNLSVWQRGYKI